MDKKLKLEDIVPQYIQEYDNKAKQILNAIKSYYMGYIVYDFTKLDVDSITTFNIIIALKKNPISEYFIHFQIVVFSFKFLNILRILNPSHITKKLIKIIAKIINFISTFPIRFNISSKFCPLKIK